MAVGRANYNSTTTNGASKVVASANASRQSLFFSALDGDMVLNFGDPATASNVLSISAGSSIQFNTQSPFDIRSQINVFAAGVFSFECQTEEMATI